jgi:prepilin-type N-terminal cleavage/methylation domain-containing protein
MNKCSNRQTGNTHQRGFTLVELWVTLTIFVLITMVLVAQSVRFGGDIVISNLAYDVALTLREAQIFGQSVRGGGPGGSDFTTGYGVHFNKDPALNNSYIFFEDRLEDVTLGITKNNKKYNGNGLCINVLTDECSELKVITQGLRINRFCVRDSSDEYCSDSVVDVQTMDIVYERPSANATIRVYNIFGTQFEPGGPFSEAEIYFSTPSGRTRSVVVGFPGDISIPRP